MRTLKDKNNQMNNNQQFVKQLVSLIELPFQMSVTQYIVAVLLIFTFFASAEIIITILYDNGEDVHKEIYDDNNLNSSYEQIYVCMYI